MRIRHKDTTDTPRNLFINLNRYEKNTFAESFHMCVERNADLPKCRIFNISCFSDFFFLQNGRSRHPTGVIEQTHWLMILDYLIFFCLDSIFLFCLCAFCFWTRVSVFVGFGVGKFFSNKMFGDCCLFCSWRFRWMAYQIHLSANELTKLLGRVFGYWETNSKSNFCEIKHRIKFSGVQSSR